VVATLEGHEGKILGIFEDDENENILWSIAADGTIRSWNIKTFRNRD
jgi:hypothetical protein